MIRHVYILFFLEILSVYARVVDTTPQRRTMDNGTSDEDLQKVKEILQKLNEKAEKQFKENPAALEEVLKMKIGAKSNETIDEIEINGEMEGVFGGDIILNPDQAAALLEGRRRRRSNPLSDIFEYARSVVSRVMENDEPNDSTTTLINDGIPTIEKISSLRAKRGFQTDPKYAWPAGKPIPYFFDLSLSTAAKNMSQAGLKFWADNSCVTFVEDPNGDSAMRFIGNGGSCSASLGRQGTKPQVVSIAPGCENFGTVTHEIMHALGFFHLMSSPDRDNFVTINAGNIQENRKFNFAQNEPGADDSFGVGFDFGSVMMYPQNAFAKDMNIPTIVAHEKYYQDIMGQRIGPAFSDIKMVNKAYKCEAKCPGKKCSNGGIPNSNNCSKCICPRTFAGPTCDDLPTPTAPVCNGKILQATDTWQTVDAKVGINDWVPYQNASNCFWIIKAPTGKKVVFRLKTAPASCVETCPWHGLELTIENLDGYGITMCCPSMIGKEFTSKTEAASVRGFARSNLAIFSFEYKIA